MNDPIGTPGDAFQHNMMTSFVQIAAVVILVSYCLMIVAPFAGIVIWGVVIATALLPVHMSLTSKLGDRRKLSATVLTLAGLAIVILPGWILIKSSIVSVTALATELKSGTLSIPLPSDDIADLPVVGSALYTAWNSAATDLETFLIDFQPQLREASQRLMRGTASLGLGLLQFAASIIIAGVALLRASDGYDLSCAIARRISPRRGQRLVDVSIATVRSVTNGVLGVAIIQAVLAGIGMVAMGVPHAGLLTGVVLVTSIIQVPALLVLGPIIAWVFTFADTVPAVVFAVYTLAVALSDNILKPILLGRGVDLPAFVVLIGALGGMIKFGIIGLFLGAVIVGLGYEIMVDWIESNRDQAAPETTPP